MGHNKIQYILAYEHSVLQILTYTRSIQWETGKVIVKMVFTTDIIVCRVCEGGDLEQPIDGVGTRRNLGNSSTRRRCPCNSAVSKIFV